MATRYYRSTLNTNEQKAYDILVDGIKNHKSSVILPKIGKTAVRRVRCAIDSDYPEFFFIKPSVYYELANQIEYHIEYSLSQKNVTEITRTLNTIAKKLLLKSKANGLSGDLQIAAYLHDYLTDHISYTKGDRSLTRNHNLVGALINRETVCEGYSKLYLFLLDKAGIPAIYVSGKTVGGSAAGHAWNMVKVNGKWYHVDVTWDSNGKGNKGDWDYFLLSDAQIRTKKHILNYDGWKLPQCINEIHLNRIKRRVA